MKFINIDNDLFYNGSQLSDAWIRQYSQDDHIMLSFSGPCHVDEKYMVDLQDLKDKCSIMSERMLHFIIKHTSFPLPHIVFVQRLFIARIQNILMESFDQPVMRSGDDLFVHSGKLSISVATATQNNSAGLIHTALNITNQGTPPDVHTASLDELKISPAQIKALIVERTLAEWDDILAASQKVKYV